MIPVVETHAGARMPVLGLGTWRMGEDPARRNAEVAALRLGLDLGMSLIDSAEMYGDGGAERVVAEAIRGRRDGVFVVSKVLPHHASRSGTIRAAEQSLRRLEVDCLDLYLLHWPGRFPLEETLGAFESLVEQGKIRHYGVSNFALDEMERVVSLPAGAQVATNQVLYNLTRRGIERRLLPWCRQRRITVMAYSPLEQGVLEQRRALRDVARRHGATPAQIALAWCIRQPGVVVIPKASRPEHVRENAGVVGIELGPRDEADLNRGYPVPQGDGPLEVL